MRITLVCSELGCLIYRSIAIDDDDDGADDDSDVLEQTIFLYTCDSLPIWKTYKYLF